MQEKQSNGRARGLSFARPFKLAVSWERYRSTSEETRGKLRWPGIEDTHDSDRRQIVYEWLGISADSDLPGFLLVADRNSPLYEQVTKQNATATHHSRRCDEYERKPLYFTKHK